MRRTPARCPASFQNSAISSHRMRVLLLDDLQEPVLKPGQLNSHRLGDDTTRGQHRVYLPAAVVLDQELAVLQPARPADQQPPSGLNVRRIDLHPDAPTDRAELSGRALLNNPAPDDHRHPVADLLHLNQQVTGHEHRRPVRCQVAQQAADLPYARRIEPVGRLVDDQQRRAAEHRRCQA
jgi:hypothetical protein